MALNLDELQSTILYSEELDIVLQLREEQEYFKWFLASLLFGGRISESIAKNTYRAFSHYGLLKPEKILQAGWDFLVNPVMREGGYVRYDGRKSTQILRDCEMLLGKYQGRLKNLHEMSEGRRDLENRILAFSGVGPVTLNIFLRELRPYWYRANPEVLPIVAKAAKQRKLDLDSFNRKTVTFTRIEAGLIRARKRLMRQQRKSG